jgi:hypothetical protein
MIYDWLKLNHHSNAGIGVWWLKRLFVLRFSRNNFAKMRKKWRCLHGIFCSKPFMEAFTMPGEANSIIIEMYTVSIDFDAKTFFPT